MMMELPCEPARYQMLIDGQWVEARDGRSYWRESPARRAFDDGPWPRMAGTERSHVMARIAAAIRAAAEDLAYVETLESGKPIAQARGEMESMAGLWECVAALARHIYGDTYNTLGDDMLDLILREPIGVVAMITPWNFTLPIVSQELPFALAASRAAVVKPGELTLGVTPRPSRILRECGLPDDVVNSITGADSRSVRASSSTPAWTCCRLRARPRSASGSSRRRRAPSRRWSSSSAARIHRSASATPIWTRRSTRPSSASTSTPASAALMDGYPELPFGGYKESGLGRGLGRVAIDEFTDLKALQVHLGPRIAWWHRPEAGDHLGEAD